MKQTILITFVLFLINLISETNASDLSQYPLKYVFEIVRHGARAPILNDTARFGTDFMPGELTPSGMRMRYLLGKYNAQRYGTALGPQLMSRKGIWIESTDVHRTMQSGYSELLGMFNQIGTAPLVISGNQFAQLNSTNATARGVPPFAIRNITQLNNELKQDSTPGGFVDVPIYTYIEAPWEDDLGASVCNRAKTADNVRYPLDSSYTAVQLQDQQDVAAALGDDGFNITTAEFKSMLFSKASSYADAVIAEQFEQIPQQHNFTADEQYKLFSMLDGILLQTYDNLGRQLYVTKQILRPIEDLKLIIQGKNSQDPQNDRFVPKYRLFSAHDTNIANHLVQYSPSFVFNGIPFAASIYLELYNVFGVWYIRAQYNGNNLTLSGCNGQSMCQLEPFLQHMQDALYQGDLEAACAQNYTTPSEPLKYYELKFLNL